MAFEQRQDNPQDAGQGKDLGVMLGRRRLAFWVCGPGKGPGWGFLRLSQGKQASSTAAEATFNTQKSSWPYR